MTSRRPLVAANWKMGGGRQLAQELFNKFSQLPGDSVEVVLCPPSVYLDCLQQHFEKAELPQDTVHLGAQNLSRHESGAHTGEISAGMLKEFGCDYVIVGHSERRSMYGDTREVVTAKFAMAQEMGLKPILCVGESLEAREQGKAFEVIGAELDAVLNQCGVQAFNNGVIAYEPVWAIGTGRSATPEQAQEVHAFIRQRLSELSPEVGDSVRILYGGSVKADNAAELFTQPDVDGGLIGGASLKAGEFLTLCQLASQAE